MTLASTLAMVSTYLPSKVSIALSPTSANAYVDP